jgi:hypothetical protein
MDKPFETFSDELISAFLDDELTADERARVERVLGESPEQRQTLEELRALRETMQSLPRHRLGSVFHQRVLRSLPNGPAIRRTGTEPEPAKRPERGFRRGLAWSLAAIAAALLMILVTRRPEPTPEQTAERPSAPSSGGKSQPRPDRDADSGPTGSVAFVVEPDQILQIELPDSMLASGAFEQSLRRHGIFLQPTFEDADAVRGGNQSGGGIHDGFVGFMYVETAPARIAAICADFEGYRISKLVANADSLVESAGAGRWSLAELKHERFPRGGGGLVDGREPTRVDATASPATDEPQLQAAPLPLRSRQAQQGGGPRNGTAVRLYLWREPSSNASPPHQPAAAKTAVPGRPLGDATDADSTGARTALADITRVLFVLVRQL